MDKVERLLTLTATLLETPRPLTADEIRRRMGDYYPDSDVAFHRAFERDKDDLREMGIPLALEPVDWLERPAEGYRIRRQDYYLRDPGLDPAELAALNVALSAVHLEGVTGLEALWKLGGTVDDQDSAAPLAEVPTDPLLVELFGAVLDRRTAAFAYRGRSRLVEPYRVEFRKGRWYLRGIDRDAAGARVFRLDRIEGSVELGPPGAFEPVVGIDDPSLDEPWRFGEEAPRVATLLVDAQQAALARQHLGPSVVAHDLDDGATRFEVEVSNWPAFRTFALGFLEHAELEGPPDWRDDLVAWLSTQLDGEAAR